MMGLQAGRRRTYSELTEPFYTPAKMPRGMFRKQGMEPDTGLPDISNLGDVYESADAFAATSDSRNPIMVNMMVWDDPDRKSLAEHLPVFRDTVARVEAPARTPVELVPQRLRTLPALNRYLQSAEGIRNTAGVRSGDELLRRFTFSGILYAKSNRQIAGKRNASLCVVAVGNGALMHDIFSMHGDGVRDRRIRNGDGLYFVARMCRRESRSGAAFARYPASREMKQQEGKDPTEWLSRRPPPTAVEEDEKNDDDMPAPATSRSEPRNPGVVLLGSPPSPIVQNRGPARVGESSPRVRSVMPEGGRPVSAPPLRLGGVNGWTPVGPASVATDDDGISIDSGISSDSEDTGVAISANEYIVTPTPRTPARTDTARRPAAGVEPSAPSESAVSVAEEPESKVDARTAWSAFLEEGFNKLTEAEKLFVFGDPYHEYLLREEEGDFHDPNGYEGLLRAPFNDWARRLEHDMDMRTQLATLVNNARVTFGNLLSGVRYETSDVPSKWLEHYKMARRRYTLSLVKEKGLPSYSSSSRGKTWTGQGKTWTGQGSDAYNRARITADDVLEVLELKRGLAFLRADELQDKQWKVVAGAVAEPEVRNLVERLNREKVTAAEFLEARRIEGTASRRADPTERQKKVIALFEEARSPDTGWGFTAPDRRRRGAGFHGAYEYYWRIEPYVSKQRISGRYAIARKFTHHTPRMRMAGAMYIGMVDTRNSGGTPPALLPSGEREVVNDMVCGKRENVHEMLGRLPIYWIILTLDRSHHP